MHPSKKLYLFVAILVLASISCQTLFPRPTIIPTGIITGKSTSTLAASQAPLPTLAPTLPGGTLAPTATFGPTEVPPTPYPTAILAEDVSSEMDLIQQDVVKLRGLQPKTDVMRALLTPDELRQQVVNDFMKDYTPEDAKKDVTELSVLGLIAPDFDFLTFYTNLLSEQVAGYYDNQVKEMFVVQGEGFLGPERMTYAHEYTHVLQDQNYDIRNGLGITEEACKLDSERCAAIQALMEGDASIVELDWFANYATATDQQQVISFYSNYSSPVYDSAPDFMKEDFVFPYTYGQAFVQALIDKGGWQAVDDAYQNLPVSTEQILHPERYPDDKPVPVDVPDVLSALGDGWQELDRNVMGEWYTYLILAKGLDKAAQVKDATAKTAAEGWGGDTYVVEYNEQTGQTVLVLSSVWDTQKDADEFSAAFKDYATQRFGSSPNQQNGVLAWQYSDGYSTFYQDSDHTVWILAPDAATGQAVAGELGLP